MFFFFFYSFRHVQVNNEGAIDFYKRFGFEIVETKEHYYKRIEPADAHVLQKTLNAKNINNQTTQVSSNSNTINNYTQVNGTHNHGKSKA